MAAVLSLHVNWAGRLAMPQQAYMTLIVNETRLKPTGFVLAARKEVLPPLAGDPWRERPPPPANKS